MGSFRSHLEAHANFAIGFACILEVVVVGKASTVGDSRPLDASNVVSATSQQSVIC